MPVLAPVSATPVKQHAVNELSSVFTYVPGIVLAIIIASIAIWLGRFPWLAAHGLGVLSLAIFLGIVAGNTAVVSGAAQIATGVQFSKQHLLRLGIVLYGFRLSFQDLAHVGISGFLIDALTLISTFSLSVFLGVKLFKLDRNTAILIGAGSSICGAAAIMATENVVKAKSEEVSVAISIVVLFGTVATFLYPLFYHWNLSWHLVPADADFFGVFAGSTIHDVAQVVAVAHAIGEQVERTAIVTKMGRVMMLAPFLIFLSLAISKKRTQKEQSEAADIPLSQQQAISIPWFALIFVLMVAINSMLPLSKNVLNLIQQIDACLLAMAMVALGLSTNLRAIRRAGAKPLLLGGVIFAWLMAGGVMINQMMA